MDRSAALKDLFGRIDKLVKEDQSLEIDELKKVFGEHAEEFIKYCDGQKEGAVDNALSFPEFEAGILADTKDMSDEDFNKNWIERMTGCVAEAEAAAAAEAPKEEAAPAAEGEAAAEEPKAEEKGEAAAEEPKAEEAGEAAAEE